MRNFEEEFLKLSSDQNKKNRLLSKISSIEEEIIKTKEQYNILKKKLSKEKKDVTKLESLSLISIFYKMRGNIDEKLSKEKLEFLEAEAKAIECLDYLNRLNLNLNNINKEISDLGNLEIKHSNLLKEASDYILNLNNEKSKIVSKILNNINRIKLENKELIEALDEGKLLLPAIDEAISNLKSAENWGIYDMMGGDFIATMAKRSKMNEASDSLNSIKVLLNNYNTELKDLNDQATLSLNLDGFSGVMDFLFDNFFTDYFVQNKISSALDSTIKLKNKVEKIQSDIKTSINLNNFNLNKLNEDLENIIIK